MKKMIFSAAAAAAAIAALSVNACAEDSARVYVTVANGGLMLAQAEVNVSDTDGDGALTINDALYAAHEKYFESGADGYGSAETEYGLSMSRLWGVENGGCYGYYINNSQAMSLSDPIKNGDYINAYVYTDLEGFSDKYCFFDKNTVTVGKDELIDLTLKCISFDENWEVIELPVSNVFITVDGVKTTGMTDEDGVATLTFQNAGTYCISAVSDQQTLVPPVCVITTTAASDNSVSASVESGKGSPDTGIGDAAVFAGIAVLAVGTLAAAKKRK